MQDNLKMERTIDDLMDENKKFRSKPGPTVYVGGIIIPYHMKKMKNLDAPNNYYWPELWFPTLKNKIIKGPGNTE